MSICSFAGYDCAQRQGHSPHQGGEEHPGGSKASLHCRSHLRLSDGREAIPHPGVSEWSVQAVHSHIQSINMAPSRHSSCILLYA